MYFQTKLRKKSEKIYFVFTQLLGIVVSVCMAQGWQVEDETGLQVGEMHPISNSEPEIFSKTLKN